MCLHVSVCLFLGKTSSGSSRISPRWSCLVWSVALAAPSAGGPSPIRAKRTEIRESRGWRLTAASRSTCTWPPWTTHSARSCSWCQQGHLFLLSRSTFFFFSKKICVNEYADDSKHSSCFFFSFSGFGYSTIFPQLSTCTEASQH